MVITTYSQEQHDGILMDTVLVKKDQILVTHNKSYLFKNDTILVLPSSLNYEIKPSKSESFYNNLAQRADKRLLTRELHNIIVADPSKSNHNDSVKNNGSSLPYVFYTGRPIRKIIIKQLDVFGPTVDDTSRLPRSWTERTANKFHFQTKEFLIQNNLLFKEGDQIDPIILADNERVLRQLRFIEDARIIVKPLGPFTDSTDIYLVIKDVWPMAFNIDVENIYSGSVQVWNRNILGFGQEIQSNLPWNSTKKPNLGTENTYLINNLQRTFISAKLFYNNSFQTRSVGTDLERSFFTPNIKYAGGLAFSNISTMSKLDYDTSKTYYPIRYNSFDFWMGRSFRLNRNGFTKMRNNLTITARVMRNHFFERPDIPLFSYDDIHSKALILGAITFSRHSYFKSNYIYNYGRTEDIPIGSSVAIITGKELNESFSGSYIASQLSFGSFLWNLGYLYANFNIGSFFFNSGQPAQGIIDGKINYFSPLIILKKFKFRQFFNFSYTNGINRFYREYININNNNGIRGFRNDSVYGTKRFNMHWETVCFTPWIFYDFRFVLFANADHSWIATKNEKLFEKLPYTSIRLGIRIRNERLVFNTIEIAFAFYPNLPSGSKTQSLNISGEPLLNPLDFLPQKPDIIPFK